MRWNPDDITHWLLTKGTAQPDLNALTQSLGEEWKNAGAPIWRLRIAIRTLHPLVAAISTLWEPVIGAGETVSASHGLEQRPAFAGSPLATISETAKPLRKDLTQLSPGDHEAYQELRARGASDYFGIPMFYGDHRAGILVVVTDEPGGFTDADIAGCEAVARALAPLVEVHRLTLLSTAVASAYLGPRTGLRVLGGDITRGHVDHIDAAILVSDLRGWTRLNTERPVEEAVEIANSYFDIMDTAVRESGGEVLKFMGDGVLAIFPATNSQSEAALSALQAAQSAQAHATDQIQFGIGLHIGNVHYGNVGSETRLDFTVLGTAVNMTARIEALCSETGRAVLMSQGFADLCQHPADTIGCFSLKGLTDPVTIFSPKLD